jgi:hypothetical protein
VVHAEWGKLCSLRSTWVVLGSVAVLTVGVAAVTGWVLHRDAGDTTTIARTVAGAFMGVDVFSLVIGVFGILLMTGEYGSGLIRATLAAVPRRLPVLWAKALVLVAATAPVMVVVCFASFLVSQVFVPADQRITFGEPGVLRATVGAAAAPVALGLLGLGIGTLLRHTAGAITTYVAATLVLPAVGPLMLPSSVRSDVVPYVPVAAAQAMYAIGDGASPFGVLSPGRAALVLAGWVALLLACGAVALRHRDA